jgi:hypothetical protein
MLLTMSWCLVASLVYVDMKRFTGASNLQISYIL